MKLLALDTATEACSVALACGGEVREEFAVAPCQHNRLLFEMCDALFASSGITPGALDALVFGRGPGAFTGVRIAAAAAQGIAYAHDLPVVAVSDLAALAQQLFDGCDGQRALAAIDARMGEVYYGFFRRGADGVAEAEGSEGVAPPARLPGAAGYSGCAGGSGFASCPALGAGLAVRKPYLLPRAGVMLKLALGPLEAGDTVTPMQALPVYLRDRVV